MEPICPYIHAFLYRYLCACTCLYACMLSCVFVEQLVLHDQRCDTEETVISCQQKEAKVTSRNYVCVCFRRLAQNGNVNGETWDINHRVLWYPISRQTHFNSWSNCCFTIKVDPVQLRSFCHENNWLVDSTHSSVLTWKCEVFLI